MAACSEFAEPHGGFLQLAAHLDEYRVRPVHHDVADRIVTQQRFQRPEADHVVGQLLCQLRLVPRRELHLVLIGDLVDNRLQFGAQDLGRHSGDGTRIELFHDLGAQPKPEADIGAVATAMGSWQCDDLGQSRFLQPAAERFHRPNIRPKSDRPPACTIRLADTPDTSWASTAIAFLKAVHSPKAGLPRFAARPSCLPSSGIWTVGLPAEALFDHRQLQAALHADPVQHDGRVTGAEPRSQLAHAVGVADAGEIWRHHHQQVTRSAERLHLGGRGRHRHVDDNVVEPPAQQIQYAPHPVRSGRGRPVERLLGRDQAQPLVDLHGDAVEKQGVRALRLLERDAQPADRLHAEHQRGGALPQMEVEQGDMAARGSSELQRQIDRHGGRTDASACTAHGDHAAAAGRRWCPP